MNIFTKRYKEMGQDIDPEKVEVRKSIRINTLKASEEDIVQRLRERGVKLKKVPFCRYGYWTEADFSLSTTQEYLQGHYYIQEAASQLPVQVLNPSPDDSVLDMCAAPGSKTTQLAQWMGNKGQLIALDSSRFRLSAVKNNLERCSVKNCVVFHKDSVHAADVGIKFDKVLLDAPCSGNFAIDTDWFQKRTLDDIKAQTKIQKALLRAAASCLKRGGVLVYSTCSLEPEEDEEVIEWALDNLPLNIVSTGLDIGEKGITPITKLCKRIWPGKNNTQGFFISKLVKKN